MLYFYLIILIISTSALAADAILRYTVKIKSFDVERNFFLKIFKIKENSGFLIPVHKFLPENITMLLILSVVFSASGSLFCLARVEWFFSLPCALASGLFSCFIVQYWGEKSMDTLMRNLLPKGDKAVGLDGYCTEDIEQGDWGKVRLFYTGKSGKECEFEVNAAIAEGGDIVSGEKVIIVYESDGFYFVVRVDEVYKDIE